MSDNNQGGPRGGGKGGFGKGRGGAGGGTRGGDGERPRGPRPGGAKPFRPRGDRPEGGAKPYAAKPFGKRDGAPRADRPAGGGGERGERTFRPRGDRPEGGGKSYAPRDGAGRSERPSFRPRTEAESGAGRPFRSGDGERKPFVKRDGAKPFRPRPEGREGGEGRPFRARDGEDRKPFVKRDGDRPFRPRPEGGERREDGGERRPFRPRAEGDGDRKPFRPRDANGGGDRKPFVKRDGDRPFRARPEGGERREDGGERRPFRPRAEGSEGDRRPFRPREADGGTERKPFVKRDGDRPFRSRAEGSERRDGGGSAETFVPRSRGMYGAKPASEGGERPRSHGRMRHEEGGGDERRPRALGERMRRDRDAPSADGASPRPRPRPVSVEGEDDGRMRIAKRLARAGIASRRDAEGMIADGRVTLNGVKLESPAVDVSAEDRIEIDGRPLPAIERTRLWLFHKPGGVVTTNHDPEGRETVFDRLPEEMPRVLSIGRLDINTEGLLLLTNDGGLARVLELPATGWLRRYRVRAHGEITQERLDELRQGIAVEGVFYGAIEATLDRTQGSNVWLTLGLREGKNREVKRVLGALGLEVNRLIRLSFGPFQLGELAEGEVQEVKGRTLRDQLGAKLIEESGADFDAPIVNEFSNKPVAAALAARRTEEGGDAAAPRAPRERAGSEWVSAQGAERPNRRRFGAAKREDALGRLDTRPPRPERRDDREGRSGEKRGERPGYDAARGGDRKPFAAKSFGDKPFGAKREGEGEDRGPRRPAANAPRRSANVWMAPGARAMGERKKQARAARDERFGGGGGEGGSRPPRERPSGGRDGGSDRPGGGDRPRRGPPPAGAPRKPRRES